MPADPHAPIIAHRGDGMSYPEATVWKLGPDTFQLRAKFGDFTEVVDVRLDKRGMQALATVMVAALANISFGD